ncbi:MAG TPA: hypothetical protein PLK35_04060 [Candidatus Moranbacteria bacterium]|nr:hypothetical protein [Candidatus Moranbacteria bacterium]
MDKQKELERVLLGKIAMSLEEALKEAEAGIGKGKKNWFCGYVSALQKRLKKANQKIRQGLNGNGNEVAIEIIDIASLTWRFLDNVGFYSQKAAALGKSVFAIYIASQDFHRNLFDR